MEEREVTLELRKYLEEDGWKIESTHFPGAQGGMSISVDGKTRGWVPDLVAVKNDVVLTIESKPDYSQPDVNKLNRIFKDERYLEKLRKKLDFSSDVLIQRAIVFYSLNSQTKKVPNDFVVFVVGGKNEVSIYLDDRLQEIVKELLS